MPAPETPLQPGWCETTRTVNGVNIHVVEAQLEIVEGARHWLHIEQPDRINARIVQWLGGRE